MQNQRARNLLLAKYFTETRMSLARLIDAKDQALDPRLRRQSLGEIPVSNADAAQYAAVIGLPLDWFDRDNESLLRLSQAEYELVQSVLKLVREHQAPS